MELDRILPRLFVGSYPESTEDIDRLREEFGVTAVLNLQTQEDMDYRDLDFGRLEAHYRRSAIRLRRIPVRDFDREDLRRHLGRCVDTLHRLLGDGHTVYVHCNMGAGRSPSVVIAYLHWVQGWDVDQAARHVCSRRQCAPDLDAIRLAVEDRLRKEETSKRWEGDTTD